MTLVICLLQKKDAVNLLAHWEGNLSDTKTQWPLLKLFPLSFFFPGIFVFSENNFDYKSMSNFFFMANIMCVRVHFLNSRDEKCFVFSWFSFGKYVSFLLQTTAYSHDVIF